MTKTEIDRRLALVIGYTADRVRIHPTSGSVYVLNERERMDGPLSYSGWQRFDHTDSDVFRHVAERFDAFPVANCMGGWLAHGAIHEVAATASALAVIDILKAKHD